MSKTFAICNQKGGTGKTTSAINLSAYLALAGKKVMLIDLDPQANATSGIGINKHNVKKSTYHILLEELPIKDIIVPTQIQGLCLAPANLDLTGAEVELVSTLGREYRLKKAVHEIKHEYDYIIIDAPPSLGLLTLNALSASDGIIVPVQCEYYALEGLSQLMNTFNLVRTHLNAGLVIEGVILTMADFRTNLTKEVINEVKNHFPDKVYKSVIPRSIKLGESPSFGKPIALYDKDNIAARRYEELAQEIMGRTTVSPGHDTVVTEKISEGGS